MAQICFLAPYLPSEKTWYMYHFYGTGVKVYLTKANCSIFLISVNNCHQSSLQQIFFCQQESESPQWQGGSNH